MDNDEWAKAQLEKGHEYAHIADFPKPKSAKSCKYVIGEYDSKHLILGGLDDWSIRRDD